MAEALANGKGNSGGGIANTQPPTPAVPQLVYLLPGVTTDIKIIGDAQAGEEYIETHGNSTISGAFSNGDIAINSITVDTPTELTLNITVAANPVLGGNTLTITNPNGLSATSTNDIVHVTDLPVILDANLAVAPPAAIEGLVSTLDDLLVESIDLQNQDNSVPVTYLYQWLEDGINLDSQTTSTLPCTVTQCGKVYSCAITPVKEGIVTGTTYVTNALTISTDCDNNGMHDDWEVEAYGSLETDPSADDDGDGLSNRAEYLFGLDPQDPASNSPIVSPLDPASGEFEYRRTTTQIESLTYRVETSPDLGNWTEQVAVETIVSSDANSEVVRVSLAQSLLDANPRLYVRVSAD